MTSRELARTTEDSYTALAENSFGILSSDGTTEEKIVRLLNLLPVAFQVVSEARATIERLRDENENLRRESRIDTSP